MTTAIQNNAVLQAMRPMSSASVEAQATASESIALDPDIRSRLLQLRKVVQSVIRANATLTQMSIQMAKEGIGTLGPGSLEVMQDAVLREEMAKKKLAEAALASGVRAAISGSRHSQAEFVRALSFLMPQILPEDEDGVSTPGFTPPMQNPADLDTSGLIWDSHSDFYAQISALLGVLQTEWLAKYQDAMSTFLEFYEKLSDAMEKLKIEGSGDKGDVSYDFRDAKDELQKLLDKYQNMDSALATFPSDAAAQAFKDSLGLPGLTVARHSDGTYRVMMDVSDVRQIHTSMPDGTGTWDSARYNAWVSAKDSNMEQIKHVSKVLGEKLSEMTQKYDNIVKILSSTIDKITEADMSFVHGI